MSPEPEDLKNLIEFQTVLFDKASTYTKLIIGLGYGGFFAAWSGTKQHLSPKTLVASALFETVSLILFIAFEITQTMITSYLSIEFNRATSMPTDNMANAIENYRRKARRLNEPMILVWKIIFPLSVFTGLVGGGILIAAFVGSLLRM